MDPAAVPPRPELDTGSITRLRDVLAGGHLALEADRRLAAELTARDRWPWLPDLVKDANAFHGRAATWAVRGGTPDFPVPPAAGVIFAACGYPLPGRTDPATGAQLPGGFHADAQAARPDALFAYADPDPTAVTLNLARLAVPDREHVSTIGASAREPASLLSSGHALAILERGPVMLQLQLCAQWWPPEFAAWAVCQYARRLPSGSTVALSVGVPGGAPGAAEFSADVGRAGGRMFGHSETDVAGWLKAAGMELAAPGITDVRGRELSWASAEFARQRPVARVIEAVGLVP